MVLSSLLTQVVWKSFKNAVSELSALTLCRELTMKVIGVFLCSGLHVLYACPCLQGQRSTSGSQVNVRVFLCHSPTFLWVKLVCFLWQVCDLDLDLADSVGWLDRKPLGILTISVPALRIEAHATIPFLYECRESKLCLSSVHSSYFTMQQSPQSKSIFKSTFAQLQKQNQTSKNRCI